MGWLWSSFDQKGLLSLMGSVFMEMQNTNKVYGYKYISFSEFKKAGLFPMAVQTSETNQESKDSPTKDFPGYFSIFQIFCRLGLMNVPTLPQSGEVFKSSLFFNLIFCFLMKSCIRLL
jgi:hypothetical protein